MKKLFKTKLVGLACLLLISSFGCNDNQLSSSGDKPILVDGRLKFSSVNSFANFLNSTKTNGQVDLSKIEEETGKLRFVSHRQIRLTSAPRSQNKQAREIVGGAGEMPTGEIPGHEVPSGGMPYFDQISQYLTPTQEMTRLSRIEDPQLASVLNENQEIQFGNYISKVQNDYTFVYEAGNEALITDFYQALYNGTGSTWQQRGQFRRP